MFSWIDKVIPQLPETPKKTPPDGQDMSPAPPSLCDENVTGPRKETTNLPGDAAPQDASTTSDNSSVGVLGWLTQGLGKVVPQPVDSPIRVRGDKEVTEPLVEQDLRPASEAAGEKISDNFATEQSDSSSRRVLSWLSHGLEKVVPQPSWTSRGSGGAEPSAAEQKPEPEKMEADVIIAPVSPVPPPPPVPAEVQPVVTLEVEAAAVDKNSQPSPGTGVLNWIIQGLGKVVPQPEMPDVAPKNVEEEKPLEEVAPPAVTRKDSRSRVLSWISHGLEKVIPQPAMIVKQDSQNLTSCQVEEICILPPNTEQELLYVEDPVRTEPAAGQEAEGCRCRAITVTVMRRRG